MNRKFRRIKPFRATRVSGIAALVLLTTIADIQKAAAAGISDGVVRIGVLNDMTGPLSDINGQGSVVAAKMAVEDLHKIAPSIKVEVVSADHQNKADIGLGIARKWFDVDGVDMIVDIGNSAVGLAVNSLVREKNKIAIYTSVATTQLNGKQCVKSGLAWLHDSYNLVKGPVKRLTSQGLDTWFFIAADYEFGKNMVSESRRALAAAGGKSLGAIFHPIGTGDYSSFILQAQSSGAKVVAIANAGEQLVTFMKQWTEFGMDRGSQKPVAELMFITDVHAMGAEIGKNLTGLTAFYWARNAETRAFGERFFQLSGKMPSEAQAAVYSGVLHYLKAVASTGTDDTDPVLEKMKATPVDDFYARGGTIRADGKLVHDFYLVQVKGKSEMKNPWEVYTVLETVPAADVYLPLAESECPHVKQ